MAAGRKTGGRKPGTPNKATKLLKDAIIAAAEQHGSDGKGKQDVTGYCYMLARDHPVAFATLLGKVMPTQVTGADGGPLQVTGLKVEFVGTDRPDS